MITILTPTYNRAYLLPNAFQSLCRQTSFAFEWIVVDDGSTDDTEAIVKAWQTSHPPFPLKYHKQTNGGKHRAVNQGVRLAAFDYLCILDSDDELTENAVSLIHQWIETIRGNDAFAGVAGLKGWKGRQEAIGGAINEEYIDATNLERKKYGLLGDKAEIYRTELLRKYPFPEFEGENFLRENAVWDRIAKDGYQIRWFNQIIYQCEYLEDGLTKNVDASCYIKNFQGFTYSTKLSVDTSRFPYKHLKIGFYAEVAQAKEKTARDIRASLQIGNFDFLIGKLLYTLNKQLKKMLKKVG